MKILILNYEYPPVGGGGGRVSEQIGIRLAARGHEIRVLTSRCKGAPAYDVNKNVTVKRVFSFRRRPDRCGIFSMAGYILAGIIPAIITSLKWKPDLIHAHFAVPSGVLAYIVNILTRTPYVITAHLGDVPGCIPDQTDSLFYFVKPFTFAIWKRAKAVTAVSGYVRKAALRTYNVPVVVIPNGVDCGNAARLCENRKNSGESINIVFSGRFDPQKNILLICELLKKVSNYKWTMHFIGDGLLMGDVRERIEAYNLSDRTVFHGWVQPSLAEEIMSTCDVLLIPSFVEGMPVVVLNAMALGLAVIGSDIEPLRDLITHGENGFLCDVSDVDSFVEKLEIMLKDRLLLSRLKLKNQSVAKKYDWDKITSDYEFIMRKAISE